MSKLKDIKRVYFIGIAGIGMSALARYFNSREITVSGYDRTPSSLARKLEAEGMSINYADDVALLDKRANLVVYTPAVPKDHAQLNWYWQNGYMVLKRSDTLQIITHDTFNICIAGTHGKTSISTMTAHILRDTGYGCNAFLGGISVNYDTNFWASEKQVCVVEADEYDRSFLKLDPDIAVVTAMDADHLDIYLTVEAMEHAFVEFARRIKPGGLLIRKQELKKLDEGEVRRLLTYKLNREAGDDDKDVTGNHTHEEENDQPDIYAFNIQAKDGGYLFDASISKTVISGIHLNIGGMHNIENALAAITIAKAINIDPEKIKAAVANYKGVKRRFEYVIKNTSSSDKHPLVFIDDYAHHPEELRALISSARNLFPGLKCTVVFQPHLFTRTRDLAAGFAETLDLADEVILLPIYPARELPIEGVTSELIANRMTHAQATIMTKEDYLAKMNSKEIELLITAGAGDIDLLVPELAKKLLAG